MTLSISYWFGWPNLGFADWKGQHNLVISSPRTLPFLIPGGTHLWNEIFIRDPFSPSPIWNEYWLLHTKPINKFNPKQIISPPSSIISFKVLLGANELPQHGSKDWLRISQKIILTTVLTQLVQEINTSFLKAALPYSHGVCARFLSISVDAANYY